MVAGMSSSGGPLYVGRAHHEGGLFPGTVPHLTSVYNTNTRILDELEKYLVN
jgi:hypothetical protein